MSRSTMLAVLMFTVWQSAPVAPATLIVRAVVRSAEWVNCGKHPALKTSLQISLKNSSSDPIAIGRIVAVQERIYHKDSRGNLQLVRTTDAPDEFVPPDAGSDQEKDAAKQSIIPKNGSQTLGAEHYVYLSRGDFQSDGANPTITLSFHVSDVRVDGNVSAYWSDPTTIKLPPRCRF